LKAPSFYSGTCLRVYGYLAWRGGSLP
jgi:hypothetical protein